MVRYAIFGSILFLLAAALQLQRASTRPVWEDESFGQATVAGLSYAQLITEGSLSQCSRAPLPLLLQKAWMGSRSFQLEGDVPSFRLFSRTPSFLFGLAFLGLIFLFCLRHSPAFAPLVLVTVAADPNFSTHITEDRPYTLWLLLTWITLVLGYRWMLGEGSRRLVAGLIASSVLSALTASGTVFVLAGMVAVVPLLAGWKKAFRLGCIFLPALLVGSYYALLSKCVNHALGDPANLDVIYQWQNCQTFLLRRASVEMILQYKYLSQLPGNLVLIAGAIAFWRVRASFARPLPWLFLSLMLAFLLCAAAVAYKHYYFVPRIFIFLLAGRALMMVAAAHCLQKVLPQKLNFLYFLLPALTLAWFAWS